MNLANDEKSAKACDNYAIVLHYTGNASDEDGITAQYVKITSAGKLTAHFNSFSPVAIIATDVSGAQTLANTYSHEMGSDTASVTSAATAGASTDVAPAAADNSQTMSYYPKYTGTAAQNVKLLKLIKAGTLRKP